MSQRIQGLVTTTEPQIIQADGAVQLQTYDQYVIATSAGITVTLPPSPFPVERHTCYADGNFDFLVSGGAIPLPTEPYTVTAGTVATFIFGITGWQIDSAASANDALGFYGDGSDGAAVMDGVAVFATFSSLVGSTYTLTRDAYLTNLTVNAGVTLKPGGFRLFVNGKLTNLGTIQRDGNTATTDVGATGLVGGTLGPAFGGGDASSNGVAGSPGEDNAGPDRGLPGGTGAGGAGGTTGGAGGAGGIYVAVPTADGSVRNLPNAISVSVRNSATSVILLLAGGAGGGGGSSDGAGNAGGGGGAGGGVMMVAAATIVNSGIIRAAGGNGAPGQPGAANASGGGGGGGGLLVVVTRSLTGAGTITAPAGAGGAGNGTGAVGFAGAVGNVIHVAA